MNEEEKKTTSKKHTTSTAKKTTAAKKTTTTKKGTTASKTAQKKTAPKAKQTGATSKAPAKKQVASKQEPVKEVVKQEERPVSETNAAIAKELKQRNTVLMVVAIVLVLAIVFVGSYFISEANRESGYAVDPNSIPEEEQKEYTSISLDEYFSIKAGSDLALIYIGRPGCYYCQQQTPILRNVMYLYDLDINYFNTDTLTTQDDKDRFYDSDEYFQGEWGTPLIIAVKDDQIVDLLEGLHTKEDLVTFFRQYGFIAEE